MPDKAQSLNLYEKLALIRRMVEVMQKNKSGYNYKYVAEDTILAKVKAGMEKYHVSLVPRIVAGTSQAGPLTYTKTKFTKDGKKLDEQINEILFQADAVFLWIDDENPAEQVEVPWVIVGQQSDASQAFGSALTYSNRYFLLKYFQIATPDDDPDRWRGEKEHAEQEADREVIGLIVTKIDAHVQAVLAADGEAQAGLRALIKQYVSKNGKPSVDYNSMANPDVASQLLDALREQFPLNSADGGKN